LVVNLSDEALGEVAVGLSAGGGSDVREGGGYALSKGMVDRFHSACKEVS